MAACFTCKTRKAGNGYAGKFSAYCDLCQPKGADPRTGGLRAFSAAKCQPCDEVFTTDANFDRHIAGHDRNDSVGRQRFHHSDRAAYRCHELHH